MISVTDPFGECAAIQLLWTSLATRLAIASEAVKTVDVYASSAATSFHDLE